MSNTHSESFIVRTRNVRGVVAALVLASLTGFRATPSAQQLRSAYASPGDVLLEFVVTQGTECASPASNDQITILFSNAEVSPAVPAAAFGEDIMAEFSFSGRDINRGGLEFKRRVKDRSFLGARFIRVVNAGSDGWCSGTLSLSVDGAMELSRVPLTPRKGNAGNPIQNWNHDNWQNKTYWEGQLPLLLRSRPAAR